MADQRRTAEQEFRNQMAPLLGLSEEYPQATDIFVDGRSLILSFGDVRQPLSWGDFPGMTQRRIEAAAAAAAVFAGVEFGPSPPALPWLSCKMSGDLRVTCAAPGICDKVHMAIRFLRSRALTLENYVSAGTMTAEQKEQLELLISQRKSIIVSGGTGTGKTTLLRALLDLCVTAEERLVVIEDTPELALRGANTIQLQTCSNVDMASLLRLALRLNPDRVVLGEVRGPEALELVRAGNTGHDGVLCTLHSNGTKDALQRLLTLAQEAQPTFTEAGIRSAFDYVLQLEGRGDRRRLASIWEVPKL